jgi:hypothetical protein
MDIIEMEYRKRFKENKDSFTVYDSNGNLVLQAKGTGSTLSILTGEQYKTVESFEKMLKAHINKNEWVLNKKDNFYVHPKSNWKISAPIKIDEPNEVAYDRYFVPGNKFSVKCVNETDNLQTEDKFVKQADAEAFIAKQKKAKLNK